MTSLQTAESQNSYLEGFLGAGGRRSERDRPAGHRTHPRAPGRALPAQRTQPGRGGRPGDLSLVHRRRHGARAGAARRQGLLVPQPLGAKPGGMRHPRRAEVRPCRPAGRHARPGRQHQCAGPRRKDPGARRRRGRQLRTHRRAGHCRDLRLRRHTRGRLHRPPAP